MLVSPDEWEGKYSGCIMCDIFKLVSQVDFSKCNMYSLACLCRPDLKQASRLACQSGGSDSPISNDEVSSPIGILGNVILQENHLCDKYDQFYMFEKKVIHHLSNTRVCVCIEFCTQKKFSKGDSSSYL